MSNFDKIAAAVIIEENNTWTKVAESAGVDDKKHIHNAANRENKILWNQLRVEAGFKGYISQNRTGSSSKKTVKKFQNSTEELLTTVSRMEKAEVLSYLDQLKTWLEVPLTKTEMRHQIALIEAIIKIDGEAV